MRTGIVVHIIFLSMGTLFLIIPIIIIIHEIGHAFFISLFKGRVTEISIGKGRKLVKLGIFSFYTYFFMGGYCHSEPPKKEYTLFQSIFITTGGILFNLISAAIVGYLSNYKLGSYNNLLDAFIFWSLMLSLITIIPINIGSTPTDGRMLFKLLLSYKKEN